MTLLVRDEVDIVRTNIEYHLARGVDHVVVTDNGSLDGTRDVLEEYERKGVATVFDVAEHDYRQSEWVTDMAHFSRQMLAADWIINNDADEFWRPSGESLKTDLASIDADMAICQRKNMVYPWDDGFSGAWFERLTHSVARAVLIPRLSDPLRDPLPCPYFYLKLPPKTAVRATGLRRVMQGNHAAQFEHDATQQDAPIKIYHYPVRGSKQFERKVVQGGQAYSNRPDLPVAVGWHWRRWYRMFQERGIEAALADALPDRARCLGDVDEGTLQKDAAMVEPLRQTR